MKLIKQWKRWRRKRNERTVIILRSEIKTLKQREKMLVADIQRKVDLNDRLHKKIGNIWNALEQ
jgi:hypothetical protein